MTPAVLSWPVFVRPPCFAAQLAREGRKCMTPAVLFLAGVR